MNVFVRLACIASRLGFRSGFRFSLSALLIVALLAPATLGFGLRDDDSRRSAFGSDAMTTANTGAPEPFALSSDAGFVSRFRAAAIEQVREGGAWLREIVGAPKAPEGLGAARVPTRAEYIASHLGATRFGSAALSFFGFAAPAASAPTTAAMPPAAVPAGTTAFDYNGDGRADLSLYRSGDKLWRVRTSANGAVTAAALGNSAGARIAPADYDGDGRTDYAMFDAATSVWTIRRSSDNATQNVLFGGAGDRAVSADYDADGKADIAVWRASNGTWYVLRSSDGATQTQTWGAGGDFPVVGNFDGLGGADFAFFRPTEGNWHVRSSSTGAVTIKNWGLANDIPTPADFDGDGKTDCAVFRRESGAWYAYKSSTDDGSYLAQYWGNYGDQPVAADYDGDGRADYAVWRAATGLWYVLHSSNGSSRAESLGAAGDAPTPAAYVKQAGFTVTANELAAARLSPKNATGGTDLYARNFAWGTGLVNLPGRAGMDLSIGLSYNSLVWTRVPAASGGGQDVVVFDADYSNLTPGFRFGFPTIEPEYFDAQTGQYNFLLVSPSGARTVLRQTAASNVYEATDSSYLQLTKQRIRNPNPFLAPPDPPLVLRATNGAQMLFAMRGGAYRVTKIIDNNGNFIAVNHDEYGVLRSVVDTLGRIVSFKYYAAGTPDAFLLESITQQWQSGEHTWATFIYSTKPLNPNFEANVIVNGPGNGTQARLLDKVQFADGSSYRFDYNAFGQVYRVNRHGADNGNWLNFVGTDLDAISSAQVDCPRFTKTKTKAQNFNMIGGTPQEVVTQHNYHADQEVDLPDGAQNVPATLVQSIAPDGVLYTNTYYARTGWAEGLPLMVNDLTGGGWTSQRLKYVYYAQDDANAPYPMNPRVVEARISDSVSARKTKIEYYAQAANSQASQWGRVKSVKEYNASGGQDRLLRSSAVQYKDDAEYTSRRIIALPATQMAFDDAGALVSKVVFSYDDGDFSGNEQTIAAVQHDAATFGASFVKGRGNLTATTRCDADQSNGETCVGGVTSNVKYNIAGATVASSDALGRTVKTSYVDAFDGLQPASATFAYPTRLTDAAGNFSSVKYRYDIGANVWAQSPPPTGQTVGKISTRAFDQFGRLEKEAIRLNNQDYAYKRYIYSPAQNVLETRATVTDQNDNGTADVADEIASVAYFDGAGRTRLTRAVHPGDNGRYVGQVVEYNVLGQVKRSSAPTEVNQSIVPTGADARGVDANNNPVWLWTSQEYDWKGRVKRTINTDGTDKIIDYEGCGCAGGETVTTRGEAVSFVDNNGAPQTGRRATRTTADVLGRTVKSEVLNWDGSPYSTTVNTYNGRDQVTLSRVYAGAEGSATFEDNVFDYDGHGRLKKEHRAKQDANRFTSYSYFADDQIQTVTDARGATTNYAYNDPRGLLTGITYGQPTSNEAFEPWIERVNRSSFSFFTVRGLNFAPNVEIIFFKYQNGFAELGRYDASRVSSGTSGDRQTLTFQMTEAHLVNTYNQGALYFQVRNVSADKKSDSVWLHRNQWDNGGTVWWGSNAPAETVLPTAPVGYQYDAAGNLDAMSDGSGTVDYEYNQLSQMTAETRHFSDYLPNAPAGGFRLEYGYELGGQLKRLKDPYGQEFNYAHDKTGQLLSVSGTTAYAGISNYASGAQYRAWGALKHLSYGNGTEMNITEFNDKLQANNFETRRAAGGASILKKRYQYYADGSLRYSQDELNARFDRLYQYDNLGRTVEARTGAEARGATDAGYNIPYNHSYRYNQFGNITTTIARNHGGEEQRMDYDYVKHRLTYEKYDAEGNTLFDGNSYRYDVAQRMVTGPMFYDPATGVNGTLNNYFDGNGRNIKRINGYDASSATNHERTAYFVRSSVLGGEVVSETNGTGAKVKTYVRASGTVVATQLWGVENAPPASEFVLFEHKDASIASLRTTKQDGTDWTGSGASAEFDPLGQNVGLYGSPENADPATATPTKGAEQYTTTQSSSLVNGQYVSYAVDGIPVPRDMFMIMLSSAMAEYGGMQFGLLEMSRRMSSMISVAHGSRVVATYADAKSIPAELARKINMGGDFSAFYTHSNWASGLALIGMLQQTQPTPLSGDDLNKWQAERDRLLELLKIQHDKMKTSCRLFLEKRGFDVKKIVESLEEQTPYDGLKSTNNAEREFSGAEASGGISVAGVFKQNPKANAASGFSGNIYYRNSGIVLSTILHETLHVINRSTIDFKLFVGFNDPNADAGGNVTLGKQLVSDEQLQNQLGAKVQSDTTNIEKVLEDNGCK